MSWIMISVPLAKCAALPEAQGHAQINPSNPIFKGLPPRTTPLIHSITIHGQEIEATLFIRAWKL